MRVLKLIVQNFLGVKAVEIVPEGNIVKIEGRNGQGKSSVIQAIWAAVGGSAERPERPIRKGEKNAKIVLDLGDLVVTRNFTEKTESLSIKNAEGWEPKRPQEMLEKLFTRVSLDPQEFIGMKPKERRELLLQVTGQKNEIDKLQAEKDKAFAERTIVNREIRMLEGKLVGAPLDEIVPEITDTEKSVGELMKRLNEAREEDAAVNELYHQKDEQGEQIEEARKRINECTERIETLQREIEVCQMSILDAENGIAKNMNAISNLSERIKAAPPSRVNEIQAEIDCADEFNESIRKRRTDRETIIRQIEAANELRAELLRKNEESAKLSAVINESEAGKLAILQNSSLPVKNLSIDGDILLVDDIPFDDLSTSEQIKLSMAIGISQNPKLRVLRISRGRELDAESMAEVEAFAAEHDCQIWIECVSDSPTGGIFIEDGRVAEPASGVEA